MSDTDTIETAEGAIGMTAVGGEPPDYIAGTPQIIEETPLHPGDKVALLEHRPAGQRCASCGVFPRADAITDYTWNTWTCPLCGHSNATDFARQPARAASGSF